MFVGTQATGANVLARLFAVDFDLDFVHVGIKSALGVAVGVAHIVARDFALSANDTNSAHGI